MFDAIASARNSNLIANFSQFSQFLQFFMTTEVKFLISLFLENDTK
jgi:hypothetical protein